MNDHLQHTDPIEKSPSNVVKIFHCLDGQVGSMKAESWPDMRQDLSNSTRRLRAHYQIGVGVNEGIVDSLKSAGFGIGILSRVIRAWMWLSRHYRGPQDRIVIIGFSRGAYTSAIFSHLLIFGGYLTRYRDLCETMRQQELGQPRRKVLQAREKFKIQIFQEAIILFAYWYLQVRPLNVHPLPKTELEWTLQSPYLSYQYNWLGHWLKSLFTSTPLQDLVADWPESVDGQKEIIQRVFETLTFTCVDKEAFRQKDIRIPGSHIVLGLWDVVPSIGEMFTDSSGRRLQHDHTNPMVIPGARVFHAVALDETRVQFTPRVFATSEGLVEQKFFAGDHSDVGGSYAFFSEPNSLDPDVQAHHDFLTNFRPKSKALEYPGPTPPRSPSRDPNNVSRKTTVDESEPFHECCLSDITLGWMIERLDSAIRLADGGSIFQPQFSEYGAELAQPQPDWERWRRDPLLIHVRPAAGIPGLWHLPIRLLPDPHGLAHLEGTQLFPRLFPKSAKVKKNLHASVIQRSFCAHAPLGGAQRFYIFNSREQVLSATKKRSIQTHKYQLYEFSTVLTHLIGNEDATAKAIRGDPVLALFVM